MVSKGQLFLGLLCVIPLLLLMYSLSRNGQSFHLIPPNFIKVVNRVNPLFNSTIGTPTLMSSISPSSHVPQSIPIHWQDKWKGTNRSVTIVTAYFDIGKFPKGGYSNMRSSQTYSNWLKVFGYMENNLVIYTDTQAMEDAFRAARANYKRKTTYIRIKRDSLWPFQIIPQIKKLYSTPGYPRHYPNTFIPEYTSLTHSKQPILADAAKNRYFDTDYYCWFDIGYFRDIVGRNRRFWMEVPDDFDKNKIGVTRVYQSRLDNIMPKTIIYGNRNWVGGGLFLGIPDTIIKFAAQYKRTVMRYLNAGLMNVEQHILYAMYTTEERKKHPLEVDLQLYIPGQKSTINGNPWFYLGYVMYRELKNITTTKKTRQT